MKRLFTYKPMRLYGEYKPGRLCTREYSTVRHVVPGRIHGGWALFWMGVIRGLYGICSQGCTYIVQAVWKGDSPLNQSALYCVCKHGSYFL